ncbi:MAG: MerR family DNA-binding transcriptional regulator, partial [Moraxellaceae bacterium]
MNIGQAAKQSTLSTKMIRYYEEIGLIEKVRRSDSGYRLYSEQDIKDLTASSIFRKTGLREGELDLLAGCPPCQDCRHAVR